MHQKLQTRECFRIMISNLTLQKPKKGLNLPKNIRNLCNNRTFCMNRGTIIH